jgi:hypothetical protein
MQIQVSKESLRDGMTVAARGEIDLPGIYARQENY